MRKEKIMKMYPLGTSFSVGCEYARYTLSEGLEETIRWSNHGSKKRVFSVLLTKRADINDIIDHIKSIREIQ